MAKLHELLAAEPNVVGKYNVVGEETLKVLGKPESFQRWNRSVTHFDEGDRRLDTSEVHANVTTVKERLAYSFGSVFNKRLDFLVQKDVANQNAVADVIVNGEVVISNVPGVTLLALEGTLAQKRDELIAAPTLQAGPVWEWDKNESMWRTKNPEIGFTTRKNLRVIQLAPPTEQHPEQVTTVPEDVKVAKVETTRWSGMLTSAEKNDMIGRLDALLVAIKKARQRANRVDIKNVGIGAKIGDFILNGPPVEKLVGSDTEAAVA